MTGFWTKTPDGHAVHINGNPQMSKEQAFALSVMLDAVAKQFAACGHTDSETIFATHYGPRYNFMVRRCRQCHETTVDVLGNDGDQEQYLATLPTWIAPYATNRPAAGYAYYWKFDSLNHSTPPIAPAPE